MEKYFLQSLYRKENLVIPFSKMLLSPALFVAVVILFFVWLYKYATYKPENFPPGPPRVPIFGSYIFCLMRNWNLPHLPVQEWTKKYGPFFGMYFGDTPCLITTDYDTVKEILNRPEFDGRTSFFGARLRAFQKDLGIFFTDGPFWHQQRRFSLRYLRDFGFGRRFEKLERFMQDEIQALVDHIKNKKPAPYDDDIWKNDAILFPDILFPLMMNSVMSMFGMESAQIDSPKYRYIRDVGRGAMNLQKGTFAMGMLNAKTWTRFLAPGLVGYKDLLISNKILQPFMKEVIEENKKTILEDEFRNFFDMYIARMKEELKTNPELTTFSEEQLLTTATDYMFPAVTAVSGTIVYIIHNLLHRPDVEEKMVEEIEHVVGKGRLPTLDDRQNMPYTEAVIREIMRKDTFVPLGITHKAIEDTTFRGYSIPKDTVVYTSLYGVHYDKKIWGDPKNFRPERFIDPFTGKIVKKDYSLPFGAGKRLCAGETFARNSLFLLTAGLIQNFHFKVPKDRKMPDLENKTPGLACFAKDICWMEAVCRH